MAAKQLLVIVNNFPPDLAGGADIFADMCKGLARQGFKVTVHCAYPYYPEWKDKSGRNGLRIWRYDDENIRVERYGLYIPGNPRSFVQRLVHEASFFLSLLRGVPGMRRYDVVMAYYPAVTCLAAAALGRMLFRKPLWMNVQDLAADAAVSSGLIKAGMLSRLLMRIQRFLFNQADVWSTISPPMAQQMLKYRKRAQPLLLMPNWLHKSLADEIRVNTESAGQNVPNAPVKLLYSGNIGVKQNLMQLLQAFAASDADFHFLVRGGGASADEVRHWIRNNADARFEFSDFTDEKGFADALAKSDYFVIPEAAGEGASFMPSKLIPAIAAGTPVLAVSSTDSPLGHEVLAYNLGLHFEWNQVNDIATRLSSPEAMGKKYTEWSENAVKRSLAFDREILIKRFSTNLELLADGQRPESDY